MCLFSHMGTYSRTRAESGQPGKARASKIRGDAVPLPVAIAGRFRALRTLKLLLLRGGAGIGGLAARLGFGERALGGWRQLLAFRADAVSEELSVISNSHSTGMGAQLTSQSRNCLWQFLHLAYSHAKEVFPFQWHEPEPFRFPRHCRFHAPFKIRSTFRSARSRGAAHRGRHSRWRPAQATHP